MWQISILKTSHGKNHRRWRWNLLSNALCIRWYCWLSKQVINESTQLCRRQFRHYWNRLTKLSMDQWLTSWSIVWCTIHMDWSHCTSWWWWLISRMNSQIPVVPRHSSTPTIDPIDSWPGCCDINWTIKHVLRQTIDLRSKRNRCTTWITIFALTTVLSSAQNVSPTDRSSPEIPSSTCTYLSLISISFLLLSALYHVCKLVFIFFYL